MLTVAIIEDEPDIVRMYKRKFEANGFRVISADNGKTGLELIEKTKPDIILLDLMMPVLDGGTMLKQLRDTDWGKDIPVFVLTNLGDEDTMKSLEYLNIEQYMVKADYVPSQVLEIVKEFASTLK